MAMVKDCYPDHDWHQLFSDPGDFGFGGTARLRTWCIGAHKDKTICLYDPFLALDAIVSGFSRLGQTTQVKDYMIATTAEIILEAQQLSTLRQLPYVPGVTSLRCLLLAREEAARKTLDARYMIQCQGVAADNPNLVYYLGDNPSYGSRWSAKSDKVPTYRMTSGIYWVPSLDRWMTSKERLASMGWPVTPECATAMSCPMIGARDPHQAASLCGNAMHLQSAGIFQMLALSCFGPAEEHEMLVDPNNWLTTLDV